MDDGPCRPPTFGSGSRNNAIILARATQTGVIALNIAEVGMRDIKRMALRGGLAKLISQAGSVVLRLAL